MTPAAAPLPPEEIERLEFLVKHGNGNGVAVVTIATISSLLAEIEAGRAGAERVREAAIKECVFALPASRKSDGYHSEEREGWNGAVEEAVQNLTALLSPDAALRQAAQTADGALVEVDCNCRHPGLGGDCDGSCATTTGVPGRVLVPAAPAQVGAQPAGRVEPDTARLDWLAANPHLEISHAGWDDEDAWQVYAIHGGRNDREWHLQGKAETLRDAIDAAMSATPPTAGAVDDGGKP